MAIVPSFDVAGAEKGAGRQECALGTQLVGACPVGGDKIWSLCYGIVGGDIEKLEEYDVIDGLLVYSFVYAPSPSKLGSRNVARALLLAFQNVHWNAQSESLASKEQ